MDRSEIGRQLRALRQQTGLRLVDVARRAGMATSTLHYLEHGQISLLPWACRLGEVLDRNRVMNLAAAALADQYPSEILERVRQAVPA